VTEPVLPTERLNRALLARKLGRPSGPLPAHVGRNPFSFMLAARKFCRSVNDLSCSTQRRRTRFLHFLSPEQSREPGATKVIAWS
jgi:hypothetical protein